MMRLSSTVLAASLALASCSTAERGRDSTPASPTIIRVQQPPPSSPPGAQQNTTQSGPARDGTGAQGSELQPCIPPEVSNHRPGAAGTAPTQPPTEVVPPAHMPGPPDVKPFGPEMDTTHGPAPKMPSIPDAGASPM